MHSHLRTIPREQLEESIRELADMYPRCFITNGRMRLPLKIGIEADLRQDDVDEDTISAVSFYTQSWNYLQCLQAGAERVDLDGIKAGVVTEQEASAARKRYQEGQAEVARRRSAPSSSPPAFLISRRSPRPPCEPGVPEEAPAPPAEKPAEESPRATLSLARLQKTLQLASDVAAGAGEESLRTALVVTALKILIGDAEKAITTLTGGTS
jgi:ProP effector